MWLSCTKERRFSAPFLQLFSSAASPRTTKEERGLYFCFNDGMVNARIMPWPVVDITHTKRRSSGKSMFEVAERKSWCSSCQRECRCVQSPSSPYSLVCPKFAWKLSTGLCCPSLVEIFSVALCSFPLRFSLRWTAATSSLFIVTADWTASTRVLGYGCRLLI